MNKTILFLILSIFSLTAASETDNNYNEKIKERLIQLYSDIPKEKTEEESKLLKEMFSNIDGNENISEYKKFLSKKYVVFFVNKIYVSNNEDKLLNLAKEGFPLSVCFAFQYQEDTSRILNEYLSKILYNDSRIMLYNQSANYLYSEELMNKLKSFFPDNPDEIRKNCSK